MKKFVYDIENLQTEDDVENKFLQELFTKILGYDINSDLKWKENIKIQSGCKSTDGFIDLAVYKNNKIVLVVETKKPTESVRDNIKQVDSYAFHKEVRYSLITNGVRLILREYLAANQKINLINTTVTDLITKEFEPLINLISKEYINTAERTRSPIVDLNNNEITDYRRFFRSIHNIIRDNEKLDPASCFDEFSKILYLVIANDNYKIEKNEKSYFNIEKFKNVPEQVPMDLVNKWFTKAMENFYGDVFEEIPKLNIKIETLEKVLNKLGNSFHIKDSNMDIKGRAFEAFLPSQLRGKGLGQFFTPRKIVDFMVEMADIDINDIIIDFACGSGGFLIKSYEKMAAIVEQMPETTFKLIGTTQDAFKNHMKENQLYGIDAEPRAVRVAKMNMMLWGDGKKIVRGNGLSTKDWLDNEYPLKEYSPNNSNSGCTLILANPPFIKEKSKEILSNYKLADGLKSVDAQTLFLERGLRLLKPGGRMLIVLPEGILSNDDSIKTREFLLKSFYIKAIIELPTHTFVQSGVDTVNTVVLYIEKYEQTLKDEILNIIREENTPQENIDIIKDHLNYEIFMAKAENVGFGPNGRIFVKDGEKTDLDIILENFNNENFCNVQEDIIENSLKDFCINKKSYRGKKNQNDCMKVSIKNLQYRFDPSYYIFWKNIGSRFTNFIPLSAYELQVYSNKLNINTEEDLDREFTVCSVNKNNNDNLLEFSEIKTGDELSKETQKKLIVSAGTIVYNPYRANIGSFAVVPEELDGGITSGAYYNFTVEHFNPQLLVSLFKTPIYTEYIRILSTGSVRNNFSDEYLAHILVPDLSEKEQIQLLKTLTDKNNIYKQKLQETEETAQNKMETLYEIFN